MGFRVVGFGMRGSRHGFEIVALGFGPSRRTLLNFPRCLKMESLTRDRFGKRPARLPGNPLPQADWTPPPEWRPLEGQRPHASGLGGGPPLTPL